jgi:hypothetical protein
MKRHSFRWFAVSFLILFISSGAAPAATASLDTELKPGVYMGRFTIAGRHSYTANPMPEGVEQQSFTLNIPEVSGRMLMNIGKLNWVSITIDLPIRFTFQQTIIMKPTNPPLPCLGHTDQASGKGTLHLGTNPSSWDIGTPKSIQQKFSFTLGGFSAGSQPAGKCPEWDYAGSLRTGMEIDLKAWFGAPASFTILSPTSRSYAGTCDLEDWGYDPYRTFVCTWYVERVPSKK